MEYQIQIIGMHCLGCKNLITMELEDAGLEKVNINLANNIAKFKSAVNYTDVKNKLDSIFNQFSEYKYINFKKVEE